MDYEVRPFEALGPISFGLTIDQVQSIIGPPDRELEGIAFYDSDLRIEFDADGKCNSISTIGPEAVAVASGVRLIGPLAAVVRQLEEAGFPTRVSHSAESTVLCDHFGFALWRENSDRTDIEAVSLWPKGLWHENY